MVSNGCKTEEIYLRLFDIVTIEKTSENLDKVSELIKCHYNVDEICFILNDKGTDSVYSSATTAEEIVNNFEDAIQVNIASKLACNSSLLFGINDGKLFIINHLDEVGSFEPMGHIIPLAIKDLFIGTLIVFSKDLSVKGSSPDIPELPMLIPFISHLIHNSISHEQKDKKIRLLNLYQTVSSALSYIGDLHELLTTIVSIVTTELDCEECSILLFNEESNEFEFYTIIGDTGMHLEKIRFPADRGIAGKALRERKTQVVNDAQSDPDFYTFFDENYDFKTRSILAAPILSGDVIVGVINAINKLGSGHFTIEDDQTLSAIADEVALAVKNAKLFDFLVDSYCNIRRGLKNCQGCIRPLKSWTPCVKYLNLT